MKRFDTRFQKAQFKRFARLCDRDSPPLMMILKAHLLAESLVDAFIRDFLRRGDVLVKRAGLSFSQKVSFFEATDYSPDTLINSLRTLNKIRNRLAHDAESDVSHSDVQSLCRCFGDYFDGEQYRGEEDDELLYVSLVLTVGCLSYLCEDVSKRKVEFLASSDVRLNAP